MRPFTRLACIALLVLTCLLPGVAGAAGFTATGSLAVGRAVPASALLPNGMVLFAGGWGGDYLNSAELYNPSTGTFTPAGNMGTARGYHSTTLLPNGKVLVVGGRNSSGYQSSAEIFDPATGTFSTTGSMVTARGYHTATLLPNKKVLIVGGQNGSGSLRSAELYDPETGTFTTTGDMTIPRTSHAVVLLPNGKVLATGGSGATAELYDPGAGTWAATGSMTAARSWHTATVLTNGTVLVSGGSNGAGALSSTDLYDPATGTFASTGNLGTARKYHTATLLPNGKVLITGGDSSSNVLVNSAELYDPAAGSFSSAGTMTIKRAYHTATMLPSGRVLIAAGSDGGQLRTAELYEYTAGSFTATGAMGNVRTYHSATLLPNGKVLVAGGSTGSGFLASSELYNPATGTFTSIGVMGSARSEHTATLLPNGKVLVAGGFNGSYLGSAELYGPSTGTFSPTGPLGSARNVHTATLLPNGKVLVAGGYNGSYLGSAELYDPATGIFTATGAMGSSRGNHTATFLPSGKVLITGGYNGSSRLGSAELYDPATGIFTATGVMGSSREDHTATLLPNGKVLVAGGFNGSYLGSAELYDPATGTFTPTGSMGSARVVHTATLLPNGKVLITGGYSGSSYLGSAELYDPATGTFTASGAMGSSRDLHAATLLQGGTVLITGGYSGSSFIGIAELHDPGLAFSEAWRPIIAVPAFHPATLALTVSGNNFQGNSEGSSGGTNNSATNYPLLQLQRIDNGKSGYLLYHPTESLGYFPQFWSEPLQGYAAGHYLATIFANGIPSQSQIIRFAPTIATVPSTVDFGSVATDAPATQAITIQNFPGVDAGPTDLAISSIATSGNSAFSIAGGGTCGTTLAPLASCTVVVRFAPSAAGSVNASLVIISNDPDNGIKTIHLAGTGIVPTYPVTVTVGGTGSGIVHSTPSPDINCSGSCSQSYDLNTPVTLTPAATLGSFFTGWGLDCSGTAPCPLTMNSAKSAEATFTSFTPLPMGSTNYNELGWFGSTGDIPLAGSNHDLQSGDFHSFGTAENQLVMYDITTSVTGFGSVTCPTPTEHGFTSSCSVTPAQYNRVVSVTGCGGSWSGNSPYVTAAITGNCAVTAQFEDNTAPVTTPSVGGGTYTAAQSVALTCQDFGGSGCAGTWFCTGNGCTPDAQYISPISITNSTVLRFYSADTTGNNEGVQQADYTIQSSFNLSVTIAGSGSVRSTPTSEINCSSGTCTQPVTGGNLVKLVPTAASGYYFSGWTGCDSVAGKVCSVTMSSAKGVTATFTSYPAGTIAVAAGYAHTVALKSDGTVWAWGSNSYGQVGDGSTVTYRLTPVQVSGLTGITAIAVGYQHSLALRNDGTVWAWGWNWYGQLGDGAGGINMKSLTPVQAINLSGIVAIESGENHSLALKNDGTVWAWGRNDSGQLGNGGTGNQMTPVMVSDLSGVTAITAGDAHSTALKGDGSVVTWGANGYGQLGDGTSGGSRPIPGTVNGLSDIIAITAGLWHSIALKNDGTVLAWGSNNAGQLGDGTSGTNRLSPVQVNSLSGVTAIAAGLDYSMALKSDGTVHTWGGNAQGQLGDGSTTGHLTPMSVSGLSSVTSITAGWSHSAALKSDGTIVVWGNNGTGQLGDATTAQRLTPVKGNPLAPCNALVGTNCYATISAAYLAANSGDIVKAQAINFTESLTANRPVNVTILGGYTNGNFDTRITSHSSVTGLTVTGGTLMTDQLTIR